MVGFWSVTPFKVDNTSEFQKNSKFRLISTSYTGYDETFEVTKDENGDYKYIDPSDTTSEFVPVRNHGRKSSHN